MVITTLVAIIIVLILVCVDLKRRLEKGKRGEAVLENQINDDADHILFLEDNLSLALDERDLFEEEVVKYKEQRADAWKMMGQLVDEDLKKRPKVPENVSTEIGRNGVHYVFNFLPQDDLQKDSKKLSEIRSKLNV